MSSVINIIQQSFCKTYRQMEYKIFLEFSQLDRVCVFYIMLTI